MGTIIFDLHGYGAHMVMEAVRGHKTFKGAHTLAL